MPASVAVRVVPRSSRNVLSLMDDGSLKAWVSASPTDGQANEAVCVLVAAALDVPKSHVNVSRGVTSRSKVLLVDSLDEAECRKRLARLPQ